VISLRWQPEGVAMKSSLQLDLGAFDRAANSPELPHLDNDLGNH
jgi:hypothetical protein